MSRKENKLKGLKVAAINDEDWWLVTIDDNRGYDDGHMYRQLKKCGNFEKCILA